MHFRTVFLLVAFAALIVATNPNSAFGADAPAVGTAAPEFSLPSQDGNVDLKDYRGKWVVVYFYPKDQTQGCTIEAHNFQRDQPQYADRHAVVLGVSVDTVESHKAFCAKEGLNFKLLADTEHKVVKEYGSTMNYKGVEIAARNTFIIDPQGNIEKAYTGVDPNKHSQEVLTALDELTTGMPMQK